MKIRLKRDKYKSARGGDSKLLNIFCRKCGNLILTYQKDGPGSLIRLYFDRIFSPEKLVDLQKLNIKDVPVLKCSKCDEGLGTLYIYVKENRKAFRLLQDSITKKNQK